LEKIMDKSRYGSFGIIAGSIALILALVHFWAGPFSPQPTLESVVAQKAALIRSATIDALKGKEAAQSTYTSRWDADKVADVTIALLGGIALILAAVSMAMKEPIRLAGGAAALGIGAIAFQFIAMYAMALLVVFLVAAVLSSLGAG
jgi:cobalamin synthase